MNKSRWMRAAQATELVFDDVNADDVASEDESSDFEIECDNTSINQIDGCDCLVSEDVADTDDDYLAIIGQLQISSL